MKKLHRNETLALTSNTLYLFSNLQIYIISENLISDGVHQLFPQDHTFILIIAFSVNDINKFPA